MTPQQSPESILPAAWQHRASSHSRCLAEDAARWTNSQGRNHTDRDRSGLVRHSSVYTSAEMRGCGALALCLGACPWGWGQICLFLTWGLLNDIKSITSSTHCCGEAMIKAAYRKVHGSLQFWGLERALDHRGRKEGSEQAGTALERQLRAHVLRQQPRVRGN